MAMFIVLFTITPKDPVTVNVRIYTWHPNVSFFFFFFFMKGSSCTEANMVL